MDAQAGSEMASTPSPPGVLFAVNVYPKRKRSRPSGPACCFVFGYRAVGLHSNGWTALHWAAHYDNRRIVRLLIAAKADVDAKTNDGCAVPHRHRRMGPSPAACRAGPRRCTMPCRSTPLHYAVDHGHFETITELLLSGALAIHNCNG